MHNFENESDIPVSFSNFLMKWFTALWMFHPPGMLLFKFKFFRHLHPLLAHSFSFWGFRFQTGIHFRASLSAAGRLLSGRFCLYSPAALLLQTPLRMLPSPRPPSHSEHVAVSQEGFSFSSSFPVLFLPPKCLFPQGVLAQTVPSSALPVLGPSPCVSLLVGSSGSSASQRARTKA